MQKITIMMEKIRTTNISLNVAPEYGENFKFARMKGITTFHILTCSMPEEFKMPYI